jgi:ribosomal protein L17
VSTEQNLEKAIFKEERLSSTKQKIKSDKKQLGKLIYREANLDQ